MRTPSILIRRSVAKATTEGPAAYVIPADEPRHAALAEFLTLFRAQGVEAHRALATFKVKQKTRGAKGKEEEKEVGGGGGGGDRTGQDSRQDENRERRSRSVALV